MAQLVRVERVARGGKDLPPPFDVLAVEYLRQCMVRFQANHPMTVQELATSIGTLHQELVEDFRAVRRSADLLVVVCTGSAALGFAWLEDIDLEVARVSRLHIRPDSKLPCDARVVLAAVVDAARKAGCRRLRLLLDPFVPEDRHLYELVGFEALEETTVDPFFADVLELKLPM